MNTNPVAIRTARPEEASLLSAIALASKAMHGYTAGFMEQCRSELTWTADDVRSDSRYILVADLEGSPVGFGILLFGERPPCDLEALFILPDHTGHGIGRQLLERLVHEARQRGYAYIEIQSDPGAAAFYEQSGAVHVRDSPSGSIPGRMLPVYHLTLA